MKVFQLHLIKIIMRTTRIAIIFSILLLSSLCAQAQTRVEYEKPDGTQTTTNLPTLREAVTHAQNVLASDRGVREVTIALLSNYVHPRGQTQGTFLPTGHDFGDVPDGQRIVLRGEPWREVMIKGQFNLNSNLPSLKFGDNWTVQGLVFDGDSNRPENDDNRKGSVIQLRGSHIIFEHNEVRNTTYGGIFLGEFLSGSKQASDITVRHNFIHDCYDKGLGVDRHGISTAHAKDLIIAYNDIYNCSGDAFQVTNYINADPGEVAHPTSSANVKIIGNRMWAEIVNNETVIKRKIGENAIDIKRAGHGLLIQDNVIWGYRATPRFGDIGTGDGSKGDAIVIHGQFDNNRSERCQNVPCAIIEGNDISDCSRGIAIGTDETNAKKNGSAFGVWVRSNYVHDMRGVGSDSKHAGSGLSLSAFDSAPEGTAAQENHIYRNTFVNLPGHSVLTDVGLLWKFILKNNLFQNIANGLPAAGPLYQGNHYFEARPATGETSGGEVIFRNPSQISFDSTPARPLDWLSYDYRLGRFEPLGDKGGSDPLFGERHTLMQGFDGSAYDKSADEFQSYEPPNDEQSRLVYLREHLGNKAAHEVFDDPDWWMSPDIGMIANGSAIVPDSRNIADSESLPGFDSNTGAVNDPWILVRVMHDGAAGPNAALTEITITIWAAPIHTTAAFPRSFVKSIDAKVDWNAAAAPDGRSWKRLSAGEKSRIYAFPLDLSLLRLLAKVPGASLEHVCVRAFISTAKDRRPPLFLPVMRSNNLAQRNMFIERRSSPLRALHFFMESSSRTGNEQMVYLTTNSKRPIYFYEPSRATNLWRPERGASFPPRSGRLVALRAGRNTLRIKLDRAQRKLCQLLIDPRRTGVLTAAEFITVRQGQGGFTILLGQPQSIITTSRNHAATPSEAVALGKDDADPTNFGALRYLLLFAAAMLLALLIFKRRPPSSNAR
jgi:hypothetical protein